MGAETRTWHGEASAGRRLGCGVAPCRPSMNASGPQLSGEMSEWSIKFAWKLDLFTRADAQQNPPTQFRSTTSRNIDIRRRVLVNHRVDRGFQGVCDTVLTQRRRAVTETNAEAYG